MNQLDVFVASALGVVSIMVFLFLIDYAARLLRPVSIVQRVGEFGVRVIQSVYPDPTTGTRPRRPAARPRSAARVVLHEGTSGVVLAVDLAGLVALARTADGVIEFVPHVGDFIAVGEPLFRLHGGAASIDDRRLRASVALGSERTMEQDPTFAFRILVDIAIKALSAAINDPTTAVHGDRPAAPPAAPGRPARPARRGTARRRRQASPRLSDAQLGGLRPPDLHRDPPLRRRQHPGRAPDALDAREPAAVAAAASPCRAASAARASRPHDRGRFTFAEDHALARIADPQGLGGALGLQPLDASTAARSEAAEPARGLPGAA